MRFIENFIQPLVEKNTFGVCTFLAKKWGINESRVRIYFIYTTFLAFGSPVLFYLVTAFWLNIKKYFKPDVVRT
jgi:phage shock protein PspC (stress-responsive transcriptional regulator)